VGRDCPVHCRALHFCFLACVVGDIRGVC
jgi:hypothetical protein